MNKTQEALRLALEALEWINRVNAMEYEYQQKARESLNAIYDALAEESLGTEQLKMSDYEPDGMHHNKPHKCKYPKCSYPCPDLPDCRDAEQPAQELLAWKNAAIRVGEELSSVGPNGYYNMTAKEWLDWAMEQQPRGKNSLADQALDKMAENARELGLDYEPIIERVEDAVGMGHNAWDMVKPTELAKAFHEALAEQPAQPWVGLTEQERNDLEDYCEMIIGKAAFEAIEAKLKEKNA